MGSNAGAGGGVYTRPFTERPLVGVGWVGWGGREWPATGSRRTGGPGLGKVWAQGSSGDSRGLRMAAQSWVCSAGAAGICTACWEGRHRAPPTVRHAPRVIGRGRGRPSKKSENAKRSHFVLIVYILLGQSANASRSHFF
uniref:Uncharacterized protein n=1 Tax=Human herpesvirus 2 TaxID=10310 RepID=A0A481TDI0_HHV2|nr:hypothetical protein [Human alphaherpesvirus 2]